MLGSISFAALSMAFSRHDALKDPTLREGLVQMVRRRVPESEVEDVVQATLADALAAERAPEDAESFRKWVFGIAGHKVIDAHRRGRRETHDVPEVAAESAPHGATDLYRWAKKELPGGSHDEKTLEWMMREGEGEKLESIAESEAVPAPRVRQRVVRLRKHLRERWAVELALVAAIGAIGILYFVLRTPEPPPIVRPEDPKPPTPEQLRKRGLAACERADFESCLRDLDEAKRQDPAGDAADDVQNARKKAKPAPSDAPPTPSAPPSTTATVPTDQAPKGPSKNDVKAPIPMKDSDGGSEKKPAKPVKTIESGAPPPPPKAPAKDHQGKK